MHFTLSSLVILAAAVWTVTAQPEHISLNPPRSVAKPIDWASLAPATGPVTNAKRFAQGLPPLKPRGRKHHRGSTYNNIENAALKRATRAASAPRSDTSPIPPVQQKCNILVKTADATLGYLAPSLNIFGEYGQFQGAQAGSLEVSISYVPGSEASVDMVPTNGPTKAYPFMGGAIGYSSPNSDFNPGTRGYAYVAATPQSPSGSPPISGDNSFAIATGMSSDYESAIWIYDPSTFEIRAQWVNTDGSKPTTYVLFANDGNDALVLTGDPNTLNNSFGTSYPGVTLTCVPPVFLPA
ncbi:hypothetical protein RSOLAG22IIIB_05859 [Rhizoctonia solani]|uniref:Uncharacterized protein n=1 Tax=Rhizoctonia solani TaxID=456999 RepID=A0A0K6GAE5_9AGAM|nr:hypothetical protein RSOLAG22IIIB_05859 [Rhizoctonia solani]